MSDDELEATEVEVVSVVKADVEVALAGRTSFTADDVLEAFVQSATTFHEINLSAKVSEGNPRRVKVSVQQRRR